MNLRWSAGLAYVVGIIATDGNIGRDRPYINITSKDKYIVEKCKYALKVKNCIGRKGRGDSKIKKYYVLQLRNIEFYEFLKKLGIVPAKSKTIGKLIIPDKFFADFLRGCIDGDGSIGSHAHPESKLPQLRIRLYSASLKFLKWIKREIQILAKIDTGWIRSASDIHSLSYAKKDSIKLGKFLYHKNATLYLQRKYEKIEYFLGE